MPKLKGVKITDVVVGDGTPAENGMVAVVHYRGYLNKGELFRSTYQDGQPITVRLGNRDVVAGLEKGIVGMRVGGKRTIRVSPHLGYHDQSVNGIPPNAVLIFEVELVDLRISPQTSG